MDRPLATLCPKTATILALVLSLLMLPEWALAASITAKDVVQAQQAQQLYKTGRYEDAADIYARLGTKYPDRLVFTRNLGACFYYLHRPDPALSNLREYLRRSKDLTEDDRGEVERWIAEMTRFRAETPSSANADPGEPAPLPATSPAALPGATDTALPAPPEIAKLGTSAPVASPNRVPETTPSAMAGDSIRPAQGAPEEGAMPTVHQEVLDLRPKPASEVNPESGSRWWLWTGIGAVVAGGIVTAVVLSMRNPGRDGTCSSGLNGCVVVGQ